jgi:ABC-type sugar transport system permease subunit
VTIADPAASTPVRRSAPSLRRRIRAGLPGYLLIAPAVLATVVFLLLPMVVSAFWSLTEYNGIRPPQFVGLDNYVALLTDERFLRSLQNTAFFVTMGMGIGPVLGLASAILLNNSVRLRGLFRSAFFLPTMVSLVAVAAVWKMLYQDQGLINHILSVFSLPGMAWLNDPTAALPAVVVTSIWQGFGFETVVFLAALQSISREYYDAARVDGAGAWAQFRHVTLPGLRPTILFVYVVGIIGSFQAYDQVFVMTQGGPVGSTRTVVYDLVEEFQRLNLGTASAIAYVLLVILASLSWLEMHFFGERG